MTLASGEAAARRRGPQSRLARICVVVRKKKTVAFLIPTLVMLATFSYFPFFSALYHAFFRWDAMVQSQFVGLGNFIALFRDGTLAVATKNVSIMLVVQTLKSMLFPLLVAELIFALRSSRAGYIYRVLFVLPMIVPGVVILLIWAAYYNGEAGLINEVLKSAVMAPIVDAVNHVLDVTVNAAFGWSWAVRPMAWLADKRTALGALLFMGFPWVGGINLLIVLAGLMNIPQSVVDAAAVDGAVGLRRFFMIDLRLIAGQLKLIMVLTVLGTIQEFQTQMILTKGGPGIATLTPGLHMYQQAFQFQKMGYASAIAVMMFLVMMTLTYVNMKFLKSGVEY